MKDSPVAGTKWKISPATGFEGYTIVNAENKYNGKDIYLEYYSAIKAWTCTTLSDIYMFQFYAIDEKLADPNGDGYSGEEPVAGEKPADGDKVVIYNDNAEMTFGP